MTVIKHIESKPVSAKQIFLINDMPGYGKVALAAMTPVLSRLGHYVFQLPTALVSNTLDFGKFKIQDMTDYMKETIKVWQDLGFQPDCICTGFLASQEQAGFLQEMIARQKEKDDCLIIVDPIMADGGKLYNGIGTEMVEAMQRLVAVSDVMIPNITEAYYLTGQVKADGTVEEQGTRGEIRHLLQTLHGISQKSVLITSVVDTDSKKHLVCGYDHLKQEFFEVAYEYLPVRVAGSGDIFCAVITGALLAGEDLKSGVEKATKILHELIVRNEGRWEIYKGIPVEQYWDVFANYGF